MSHPTLIQKAKAQMCIYHGFFASVLMSLPLIEDRSIPTAQTDMERIWYNPDFIANLAKVNPKLVIFVLAHEVAHVILRHGLRMMGRDPERWNIACDHAVNLLLKAAGFEVWDKAYMDAQFANMAAERIYPLLSSKGGGGGGLGCDLVPPRDGGHRDPAETSRIDRKISGMVSNALAVAKMQGRMPGDLERLLDGLVNPPLPWLSILRHLATTTIPEGESWNHRNRRFMSVYLPTKRSKRVGEIVVIGDTSASMSDVYAQVSTELTEIMNQSKPERLRVIWADDDDCSRMETWEYGEEVDIHPKGGGGTDMRRPMKFAEQFEPIIVILITDCYTPWPKEEPPYPFICVSTTDRKSPWGDTIHIN